MTNDRDRFLRLIRDRLAGATTPDGGVNGDVVFAPEADAELRGLLCAVDTVTDMEARHAAGWLVVARVSALPPERGGVHRSMAGTLLFPVWMHDPRAVPPELAAAYHRTDPDTRPDRERADGPDQWSAECAAALIAAEGQQHSPPPHAPEAVRKLYELAVRASSMAPSREALLDIALGMATLAVAGTPQDDPAYEERCADLRHATSLASQHWTVDNVPVWGASMKRPTAPPPIQGTDAAVLHAYRTLKHMPIDSPDRMLALGNLGLQLHERYQQAQEPEDLYEAIGMARDVLEQLPPGSPHLASGFSNLAAALMLRLDREDGLPEEYDEVVDLCRRATPDDPKGPALSGLNLALALKLRHERFGSPADLDEAVDVLTEALRVCREPRQRTGILSVLGNALRARFLLTGDPADLDTAIAHLSELVAASGNVTARFVTRLLTPAMALFTRYELDPILHKADLDQAERLLRHAEALLPQDHAVRPVTLGDLGMVLMSGHEQSGQVEELNEAVSVLRESVALTPAGHSLLGVRLINLAMALETRHLLTEEGDDLREAEKCRHRATTLPGLGDAHRATLLGAAGLSAMAGARRGDAPITRIGKAVAYFQDALDLTPPGSPPWARRCLNLANALIARGVLTQRRREVLEARTLAERVIAALPQGAPELPSALGLAARARLRMPGRGTWPSAARSEAFSMLRKAVEYTPQGHTARAARLTRLGESLWEYGTTVAERAAAAQAFRTAALEQQCAPSARQSAATAWGRTSAELGDWADALEGYVLAVDLLHSVAPRHLLRDDQEFLLGQKVGLGAAAAACAVRCDRPGLAVGLLEQARGVMLSHAFDADSDLTRLREAAPDLADRFEQLREALDAATGDGHPPGTEEFLDEPLETPRMPDTARADVRQRLGAEWRELTGRIRAEHPELGLLRPVREWDEREVRATAAQGPVVLVNISPYGSDALIVTEHAIETVPLPELAPSNAAEGQRQLDDALARIAASGTSLKESLNAQQHVRKTLEWLWRAVTGPVLDHLDIRTAPTGRWPRLWWSPGGVLRTLPLHAATPDDGTPGALDRVISSYTPTLRALHHARQRTARTAVPGTGEHVLIVTVPEVTGQAPLPNTRREAEHLARLLPGATLLAGVSAIHSAVVAALPRHAYVHFACHALGKPERPSDSLLVLHDHAEHPLTVRDLARLRLPSARFAYLSACDTLRTSPELADEAVHIVSAFQMSGFPHVVGSLWHVVDTIGADLSRSVYEALHRGDDGALDVDRTAQVLHTKLLALRKAYPATPSLWACQVHAGP